MLSLRVVIVYIFNQIFSFPGWSLIGQMVQMAAIGPLHNDLIFAAESPWFSLRPIVILKDLVI